MSLRFLTRIQKAARDVDRHLEAASADVGVTAIEGQVLSYLRSYSPAPVSELYRAFGIKRSTLTSMIDRLAARNWVERGPSDRDRRVVLVRLTAEGSDGARRVQEAVDTLETAVGEAAQPEDWRGFDGVMEALAKVTGER